MRGADLDLEPGFENYRIIPNHLYELVGLSKIETEYDTWWAILEDKTTIVLVSHEFLVKQQIHEPGWIHGGEWEYTHVKKLGRVPQGVTQLNNHAVLLNEGNCGFELELFQRETTVPFVQDGFLKISIG